MPVTLTALRTAAITAISAACVASALAQMAALRAAGVTGKAPGERRRDHEVRLDDHRQRAVADRHHRVLGVVVIGGLFFFGHSRAADYAAKIAIGAVIIVSAPGIAA